MDAEVSDVDAEVADVAAKVAEVDAEMADVDAVVLEALESVGNFKRGVQGREGGGLALEQQLCVGSAPRPRLRTSALGEELHSSPKQNCETNEEAGRCRVNHCMRNNAGTRAHFGWSVVTGREVVS